MDGQLRVVCYRLTHIRLMELHEAVEKGDIEAVKQLITGGADVNEKAVDDRWTPLHYAASRGCKEIAVLLIAKGAAVNAKDEDGETPLDQAQVMISTSPPEIKAARKEIADILRKHGGKTGADFERNEADLERKEIAELLIDKGVNVVGVDGVSPQDWVEKVATEDIGAVKEYLDAGTDVNATNHLGWTPLQVAAQEGLNEIAELLIATGADVNAKRGDTGWTLLHYAVTKEIAELLITAGADVNAKDNNGGTPLDVGAEAEIVDLLRKHGGKTGEELKADGK